MDINGTFTHSGGKYSIAHAQVVLLDEQGQEVARTHSGEGGDYVLSGDFPSGKYVLQGKHFGQKIDKQLELEEDTDFDLGNFDFDLDVRLTFKAEREGKLQPVTFVTAGKRLVVVLESRAGRHIGSIRWHVSPEVQWAQSKNEIEMVVPLGVSQLQVEAQVADIAGAYTKVSYVVDVVSGETQRIEGDVAVKGPVALQEPVSVRLHRTASYPTLDQALWVAIRNRTRAISFGRYQEFMNRALNWEERSYEVPAGLEEVTRERIQRDLSELGTHLHGIRAYQTLKRLTEAFLLCECGVRIDPGDSDRQRVLAEEGWRLGEPFTLKAMEEKLKVYLGDGNELPYITRVVKASFPELEGEGWRDRLIAANINQPCLIELIWSYWMEEGMLVQTMNAVSRRFQNVHASGERDPLANMEITPLRPLNNLLWGYVQDEFNRLSVRRRAYEYVHHYGLTLFGKAASDINAVDRRSQFLEAFHNLLYQASIFFKEDFQTTVIADGFPLLNALKEVHLVLAQGAQNQFGDLPWTARVEMLLMQYMLARREIKDFLQSRPMVPYKEPWEAQVDAMKTLQGWTDVTVGYFRDLAVYGEQLLLAIRFGDWINVSDEDSAKNWARYFRPEIQGYLHAYRAATGIDLTNSDTVDGTIPGILLQKRLTMQRAR
jgi:hypothetical protein